MDGGGFVAIGRRTMSISSSSSSPTPSGLLSRYVQRPAPVGRGTVMATRTRKPPLMKETMYNNLAFVSLYGRTQPGSNTLPSTAALGNASVALSFYFSLRRNCDQCFQCP